MWIFGYLICLVKRHLWTSSNHGYCLRCGKMEMDVRI